MSPMKVMNEKLYHDRTVQDWHRKVFPDDYWAMDLDLMWFCKRCKMPLYAIESTTRHDKPVSLLSALSKALNIPGLVIVHGEGSITYAKVIGKSRQLTEQELRNGIRALRDVHDATCTWGRR